MQIISQLEQGVDTNILNSKIGYNLAENCTKGLFVREDGITIGSNSDYGYIFKAYCKGIRYIEFSSMVRRIIFYDQNSNVISNITDFKKCEIPAETYYISLNVVLANETKIKNILYDNYDYTHLSDIKGIEIIPEIYANDAYLDGSYTLQESEGRIIYKFDVVPLGIYNITFFSLGSLARDIVFFNSDNNLSETGFGTSEIKSNIIVAPKDATYALVSTLNTLPISIKQIKRTDNLNEYLNDFEKIENDHYNELKKTINNINCYSHSFVSFGTDGLTESGFIRVADGTKGQNKDYICTPFLPILPGSDIITEYIPGDTSGYAFYSEPNEDSFISGTQELKNIKVPNNALYFRVSSKINNNFSISYFSASLGSLSEYTKDVIVNYNIKFSDLSQGFIEIAAVDTKFSCSYDATDFKSILLRCFKGQQFELNTIGGTNTAKAYQFFNIEGESVGTNKAGEFNGVITVPEGAYYLCVNVKLSSMPTAETDFYLKSIIPSQKEIDSLSTIVNPTVIDYTIDNLIAGNLNTYPVGNPANTGTLENYKYGIFTCAPGFTCVITTFGGYNTARGLGFIDKDNNIIYSSDGGQLVNKSFVAPEGTVKVGVNLNIDESSVFSLRLYSLVSQIEKNTKNIEALQEKLPSPSPSIPLWYGKDMFFVKDTPLDFYATEILLRNYPSYKGVYVNNAPIIATGQNYNFDLPIIKHINPEGKIYFEDGASVDIYADDGKLYKDSWNVIRNIQVHTTDISTKQKSIKVMCIGSSTTEIGMATYVKKYLETLGITMIGCGSKNDYLGTKSEGYYGWSNEQLCGKVQNAKTYPQTGTSASNPFMKLATAEDKINYPNYCFTYIEDSLGTRQSYTEAEDKNQDFYIFDFAWYLQVRQVETPDVVFYLLGTNGGVNNYETYMSWIVNRIIQACPNVHIGINLSQAYRLESDVENKLIEMEQKLSILYNYVNSKNYDKMKVVSLHAHQSPYFSHGFSYEEGDNIYTSKANLIDGYLHMNNNGYLQDAKCIGAYISYCLPNL